MGAPALRDATPKPRANHLKVPRLFGARIMPRERRTSLFSDCRFARTCGRCARNQSGANTRRDHARREEKEVSVMRLPRALSKRLVFGGDLTGRHIVLS